MFDLTKSQKSKGRGAARLIHLLVVRSTLPGGSLFPFIPFPYSSFFAFFISCYSVFLFFSFVFLLWLLMHNDSMLFMFYLLSPSCLICIICLLIFACVIML